MTMHASTTEGNDMQQTTVYVRRRIGLPFCRLADDVPSEFARIFAKETRSDSEATK